MNNKQWEQEVWLSAVRYGLGRRTYITGCISDFMIANVDEMTEKTKSVMHRDISECDDLGDNCDKENWDNLLSKLK